MHRVRFVDAAGPALVATGLAAGLAWRDCMLLAIGLVLAFRLLLLRVEHQAPWSALTAAVEAATAGAATVLVGYNGGRGRPIAHLALEGSAHVERLGDRARPAR